MNRLVALDIDGTILNYGARVGEPARVNTALLRELSAAHRPGDVYAVVSNQGGLPFGQARIAGFPTPTHFFNRLLAVNGALRANGLPLWVIRISVYHPEAEEEWVQGVAQVLRGNCRGYFKARVDWDIYTTARSRKPRPFMLNSIKSRGMHICYCGDSSEDEQAARAAGVEFVHVERFV